MKFVISLKDKLRFNSEFKKNSFTLLFFIVLIILASILSKGVFLQKANLKNILFQNAILGVVALGQLAVILTGGIDLSIGSMIGLSTVLIMRFQDYGTVPAILIAVLVCISLGLVNGLIVNLRDLPPFVVTMAMMLFAFSLAKVLGGGAAVYEGFNGAPLSDILLNFNKLTLFSIPLPFIVWIAAILGMTLLMKSRIGLSIYCLGGNRHAAKVSGVPVLRIGILVYIISATLATFGGLLSIARVGEGNPSAGELYMIDSVAAVTVGGASLFGGTGTILGVVIGVFTLGIVNNLMNLIGISPLLQHAVKGFVILVAVYMNSKGKKI